MRTAAATPRSLRRRSSQSRCTCASAAAAARDDHKGEGGQAMGTVHGARNGNRESFNLISKARDANQ